jgi:glycosyltransferase involved in cell wall biosynthesis
MKILINASSMGARPSGARNRFENIYPLMFRSEKEAMFTLLVSKDYPIPSDVQSLANVRTVRLPIKSTNRLVRRLVFIVLPLISFVAPKFDVIEDLSQPPTLLRATRRLLTIHDTRRLDISSSRAANYAYRLSLWFCRILGYRVITVSEAMAKQLSRYYPARRIYVVENCVPANFLAYFSLPEAKANTATIDGGYILAVGHLEPRKNYTRLLQAFAQLAEIRNGLKLIIVGKDNGAEDEIRKVIARLGLEECVTLETDIPDSDLITLYASAKALVFPSFYEGFGIPLLEAMTAACPLVISDIEVFHEIAGDAAIYFDPYKVDGIRSAIDGVLATEDLRLELTKKGKNRLSKFRVVELARKLGARYQLDGSAK